MKRPVVIASGNGARAPGGVGLGNESCVERAMAILRAGGDPLEAVVEGVTIVEENPAEMSVGYGGLPNAEGIVELDASVMHGPTGRAGAVAALRNVRHAARLARRVMEATEHVLLVGDGALRFARAQGFVEEELLTDAARRAWQEWLKGTHPDARRGPTPHHPAVDPKRRPTGTITCLAVDAHGDLAGATTTSGLAFSLPGRVGDSPVIGSGLFVDNQVGAAGSTGLGEECLLVAGAHTVVEAMRRGDSPEEACLEALRRVAARHQNDQAALRRFNLQFYALTKEGDYGAATLWGNASFALHDGEAMRIVSCARLLQDL